MSAPVNMLNKLARIRNGGRPRVLDLFAGCGGISLGFHRAGFELVAAVEFDGDAARSHAENFFAHLPAAEREHHARPRDITRVEPAELLSELGHQGDLTAFVDVIVGGPPCQAFARVGRAKLREVAEHPEAFKLDPRGNLYLRYLHYVRELRPLAILMENVPDVLNYGGHNIAEETCETLSELGYRCRYTLLNAVHFGVPEMRERMFLLALHESVGAEPTFPVPTHFMALPRGYESSRQVALQTVRGGLLDATGYYVEPSAGDARTLPKAVTASEALRDLPPITGHLTGHIQRGARRFDSGVPYPKGKRLDAFAVEMRTWPGFEAPALINDHVIRSLPRDYRIFRRMRPGDQYPEAFACATELFLEHLEALRKQGHEVTEGSSEYEAIRKAFVPPYDPGKFPNKWRKMEPDAPARTLMAHLGKDSYSHIHYDSEQARTISVREAARLQSFPDGFRFSGTMNPAFRQIGNAVPPLLAYRLALQMRKALIAEEGSAQGRIKEADQIRSDSVQIAVS